MFIKQLSVFMENRKGTLAEFTKFLGEHNISLCAITVADTTSFGILRAIVDDTDKAVAELRAANYAVTTSDVLAVQIDGAAGSLGHAMDLLSNAGISVEYLYSFALDHSSGAIIFHMDDLEGAAKVFAANGIKLLSHEDILNF